MNVQINIPDSLLNQVHKAIDVLEESREEAYLEAFRDLAVKKKREAEVRLQYASAYGKHPIQPDEFEIDEAQLEVVWKEV
jgi:hypothetical protein